MARLPSTHVLLASFRCGRRSFHTSVPRCLDPSKVEEVKIPVPWGHIAGKWWGRRDIEPIIALHGWQDNAGSWDPLAALLPPSLSLLALDFPGNGLSSHLPPFQNYYFSDSTMTLKLVKKYFDLQEVVLLGHSGGSAAAFFFSSTFPEEVKGYFGIDYILYAYKSPKKRVERLGPLIDLKIKLALRDPKDAPTYSWEEAKELWRSATKGSVSLASAEILMKRGMKEVNPGRFAFTRDSLLKSADLDQIDVAQAEMLVRNVKSPVCLMKGTKSHFFDQGIKYCPQVLEILRENAKSFELKEVNLGHHLHMDSPETVLPILLQFLEKL